MKGARLKGFGAAVRIAVAVLVAMALAGGPACRKGGDRSATISAAIFAGPVTLDPRTVTDAEGDKIANLICDGLVARDANLDLVPDIALSYEQLSPVSWRFFLRPNIRFSDGTPLTAEDVVFTYESIRGGGIASSYKRIFDVMSSIVAESPTTVRIDLKEPYAQFLSMLSRGIVSKQAAETMGDRFGALPVCAGPYRLVKFVPDSVVELAANANYFGDSPKHGRLVFHIVKDDNIRVLKLIKGDVDLLQNSVPPLLIERVMQTPGLEKKEETGIIVAYLGMNLADPVLKNKKVRQAFAYALDRDEIIAHRWKGLAVKANSILSPDNWAYDKTLPQYPYDPGKAAKLLDEAGWPDPDGPGPRNRFELVFKTSTVKERIDIAQMIARQLSKVGIGARVEPHEWGKFYRDVKGGNFQLYTLSWVGITEPDIYYDVCHSSQAPPVGLNRDRYSNPEVDRLLEEGRVADDRERRRAIYDQVQRIAFEDLPFVPLWYEKNVVIYRETLSGVTLRPDASYRAFVGIAKK